MARVYVGGLTGGENKLSMWARRVPPSWIQVWKNKPHRAVDLIPILESALYKDDLFASRATFIPKGDGNFRPIQVLNTSLRALKKGFVKRLNQIEYENSEEIFGFRQRKSTEDAYEIVQEACLGRKPVVFIDLAKAYNSVSREQTLKRMKSRMNAKDYDILEQLVNKQTVKVMDSYIRTSKGLPQGSSVSPVLFNHAFDQVIGHIKKRIPGVRVVAYADDTAVIGTERADIIEEIMNEFELNVNRKKSAIFNGSCRGYPTRKTYRYLGSKLNDKGKVIGITAIQKRIKEKATKISQIGKMNNLKGLQLAISVIGGVVNFIGKRIDGIKDTLNTAIKTVLGIPNGLSRETTARAVTMVFRKRTGERKDYLTKVCRLLRKDGIIKKGRRIRVGWSRWYWRESYLDARIKELEQQDSPMSEYKLDENLASKVKKRNITETRERINKEKKAKSKKVESKQREDKPKPPKKPPNSYLIYIQRDLKKSKEENQILSRKLRRSRVKQAANRET